MPLTNLVPGLYCKFCHYNLSWIEVKKKQGAVHYSVDGEKEFSKMFIISPENWIVLKGVPRRHAVHTLGYKLLNHVVLERYNNYYDFPAGKFNFFMSQPWGDSILSSFCDDYCLEFIVILRLVYLLIYFIIFCGRIEPEWSPAFPVFNWSW